MICYEFKGGIGTSSRMLDEEREAYVVGVLVQANHGRRNQLRIAGVPVGVEIPENTVWSSDVGSIIVIIATDAPLLPHQLKRLARRGALGLARNGSTSSNSSGDILIAFSTAHFEPAKSRRTLQLNMVPNGQLDPLFEATVNATEEAVVNALVAARTMTGANNHRVIAIPHDRLIQILRKYNRLAEPKDAR
jgi:L-aminopeptidase/D-esterase-like protein